MNPSTDRAGGRDADVVVIGAGIVGLTTARAWLRSHPASRVLVLDEEDRIAAHQSGRNSGVSGRLTAMAPDDAVSRQLQSLGAFIRSQRTQAQLTLRELSERTNVSNPYLSQIERGLHEPSVRVLKAIALALNVSVETMLVRAGLLNEDDAGSATASTEAAIAADPRLTDDQRASLLAVYRTYVTSPTQT